MPAFTPAWKRAGLKLKNDGHRSEAAPSGAYALEDADSQTIKKRKLQSQNDYDVQQKADSVSMNVHVPEENPQHKSHAKRKGAHSEARSEVEAQDVAPSDPQSVSRASTHDEKPQFVGDNVIKKPKAAGKVKSGLKSDGDAEDVDAKIRRQRKLEVKQSRRNGEQRATQNQQNNEKPGGYLDYLSRYHIDHDKWKFNKTFQTQLLRDVFNIYRIPSSYDAALVAYLAGLQGESARMRLREGAEKILQEASGEPTGTETSTKLSERERKQVEADNETAFLRDQQIVKDALREDEIEEELGDPQHRLRMLKRARAEQILALFASQDTEDRAATRTESQQVSNEGAKPTRKRTRGRKRRLTNVPDDESSSSESESDADSDSDSESEHGRSTSKPNGVARTGGSRRVR